MSEYRDDFLAALDEIAGSPMLPGDLTVHDLEERYGCSETKARRIMKLAEQDGWGVVTTALDSRNREVTVLRPTERIEDEPGMQEDGE